MRHFLPLLLICLTACSQLQSPDKRARDAMAELGAAGFSLQVGDSTLEVPPGKLTAISVTTAPLEAGALRGFARISLEGRLDGMPVSYIGDERFVVVCAGRCVVQGAAAPRLVALLEILRARSDALAAGDREQLVALAVPEAGALLARANLAEAAGRSPAAWFIRIDRDEALVGEAAATGVQRQLVLRQVDGRWRLFSGLP